MESDKLTHKQALFAQYVAEGDTYADAYKKAYNASKMAINTIYVKSSELVSNGKVSVRIAELKRDAIKRGQVTIDQVLEQLKNWLLFDPLELIDEETEAVKSLKDMTKEARMSLSEIHVQDTFDFIETPDGKKIKEKTGELKKIKFIDKQKVSEQFMKKFGQYLGEINDTNSHLDAIKEIIEAIKK